MRKKKFSDPLVNYENQWVAITQEGEKVIVAGRTIDSVDKKLKQKKVKKSDVIFHWVPPFDISLAP